MLQYKVHRNTDSTCVLQYKRHWKYAHRIIIQNSNGRGNDTQARMMGLFLRHETRTGYEMADAARIGRVAGSRAHTALVNAGLLAWKRIGPRRVFHLTRWGEDWLLAIGRCKVPPARPVG